MKAILIVLSLVLIAGCSNEVIYDSIQANNRQECIKLPPSQYDECMGEANKSYKEYEQEREEVLEEE